MTFHEIVENCVAEIEREAAAMGDGFGRDIAVDAINRHGRSLCERDQDYLYQEVMFTIEPYLA